MLGFSNYLTKYDNSNKLVIGKMKYQTAGVAIKEFVGLNRNVVATISYNEYKDFLLNNKCIKH